MDSHKAVLLKVGIGQMPKRWKVRKFESDQELTVDNNKIASFIFFLTTISSQCDLAEFHADLINRNWSKQISFAILDAISSSILIKSQNCADRNPRHQVEDFQFLHQSR